MAMRSLLLGLLAASSACAQPQPPTPLPEKAPAMPKEAPKETSFAKAFAAFRDHAAQHFGVSADQVVVVQTEEAGADGWNIPVGPDWLALKVGQAWPFESVKSGAAGPALRGYALADGTVVTPKQNLGRLLEEAGVWKGNADAAGLGQRLIWMLGMGWSPQEFRAPTLEVGADGTGKLIVFAQLRPAGAGTFSAKHELRITLTGDHKADLVVGP